MRTRTHDTEAALRGTGRRLTPQDRTPIAPGQTLENPVTGERFTFTRTASTTGGELLAFDFALRSGGAVPIPHVHPIQSERFEVLEGRMRFRIGWRSRLAGPGDVVEIAPGVAHSFANLGADEARVRVEVRPALAMENMLADVVALARAGRMTRRGLPRNPLDLAVLARVYDQVAHAPLLSVTAQRLALAPLVVAARVARALGRRGRFDVTPLPPTDGRPTTMSFGPRAGQNDNVCARRRRRVPMTSTLPGAFL